MFMSYLKLDGWELDNEDYMNVSFFETNFDEFKCYGRDVKSYLYKCYMEHVFRLFLQTTNKILTKTDLINGYNLYKTNKKEKDDKSYLSMYS